VGCGFLNTTTLIIAAHPDDEVLGAGIWMHRHADSAIYIVHVTDGSPRGGGDARAHGFRSRRGYAEARRRELAAALGMVRVAPEHCFQLGFPDQEAYLNLPELIELLDLVIAELQPDLVLSPCYEGGHPDHDSAAFAVAMVRQRRKSFRHWEFPLYHASPTGLMITGRFVGKGAGRGESVIRLSRSERFLKRQMLECFETQQDFLGNFKPSIERFRRAGECDFTKAPHAGLLLYERWGWGMDGAAWRARAADARMVV
jgi:LmbE family N-acetylglucosaminyl deacetylase